jgi:aspartate/methionine/tyrosine aminotransferase
MPALKRAVQAKFARDNGLGVEPGGILVAPGAKMLLYPGCEGIIPARPSWEYQCQCSSGRCGGR